MSKYPSSNESITFRIDSQKLKVLRESADESQVSLNTLVNQILTSYIE
jgi:predicted HicB family RNase H-like nuclease